MERSVEVNFKEKVKAYFLLTKPGIILGNLINLTTGFVLATYGLFNLTLFFKTSIGLSFIIGSACVFNNYIDKDLDEKMIRTKSRALVSGTISPKKALFFAIILMFIGAFVLSLFTNFLTLLISFFGLISYVFLYTYFKYRTSHGTLIGSIAGAMPPLVGYCAVANQIDISAIILFITIMLWQMPHFFAISIYRLKDFRSAKLPVLPVKKGIRVTKIQMLIYILAFMLASSMLTLSANAGYIYLISICGMNLLWLRLCIKGFKCSNDYIWSRQMFRFSLVVVFAIFIMISLRLP